jgi:hypothetical protein
MPGRLNRNNLVLLQPVNFLHDALILTSLESLLQVRSTPVRVLVVDSVSTASSEMDREEKETCRNRMRMSALTLGNSSSDYSSPENRQHAPPGLLAVIAVVARRRHADPRCWASRESHSAACRHMENGTREGGHTRHCAKGQM